MTVPFWDRFSDAGYEGEDYPSEPWDLLVIQGKPVPGISQVKCVPKMKLDVQKPNGADGAAVIARGHLPADVQISIRVWTPSQWALLEEMLGTIWRKPGKQSRRDRADQGGAVRKEGALAVSHPALDLYGVSSIVIETIDSPEPGQAGERIVKIKALQYIPKPGKAVTRKMAGPPSSIVSQFDQPTKNGVPTKPSLTDAGPDGPPPILDQDSR